MSKERRIATAELIEALAHLKEADAIIRQWQEYKDQINSWLAENFSTVDYNSDFEGTDSVYFPTKEEGKEVKVSYEYKFNRSVDRDKAQDVCQELMLQPSDIFNLKYEFSNPKIKNLDDETKNQVLSECVITKRAKLAIKVTYPDGNDITPDEIRNLF